VCVCVDVCGVYGCVCVMWVCVWCVCVFVCVVWVCVWVCVVCVCVWCVCVCVCVGVCVFVWVCGVCVCVKVVTESVVNCRLFANKTSSLRHIEIRYVTRVIYKYHKTHIKAMNIPNVSKSHRTIGGGGMIVSSH